MIRYDSEKSASSSSIIRLAISLGIPCQTHSRSSHGLTPPSDDEYRKQDRFLPELCPSSLLATSNFELLQLYTPSLSRLC
ncbi:hypothetical protein BSAE_1856 [Bifidobacterium pullorum subsp. saeculare DSM 6531 = LMG 14934]|uniref:Uncharacterized protein n=1 Tax=Bifidobacterium pullorum subsp. saeculare DSM 6531 = LMG 14934 TaxID=1437611 RepID=A0A087CPF4_9BIFI|nr:hypothetical protein BSAE_1856 [Bifidobacterium pullorum subsp. saeculare DSM 6531 = LMG 14934]